MWFYKQKTGVILRGDVPVGVGYAGGGLGKNNPALAMVKSCGPLPCGGYTIGPAVDSDTTGPVTLCLLPKLGNLAFGRTAFRIHGDGLLDPGAASHGCIVTARAIREQMAASDDRDLEVIGG